MFQPSLTDRAFDDFLTYLKDIKNCETVSFIDFTNHFCPKYKDTYLLMKKLKENGHLNYNEMVSSVPISITEIGVDFMTRTSYVNEAKKLYDKEQGLLNQNVSVGTNYGQINAGHQSSFLNRDQTFSTNIPDTTPQNKTKKSFWLNTLKYIGDNIVKIIVGLIVGALLVWLGIKK